MCEVFNAPIACVVIIAIMIVIVEYKIRSRKREIKEWEAAYAPEDQERYQGSNEG